MEASELRIGNYILFNGKIIQISGKGLYDYAYTHDYTGKHEPINLSPEILEKAGFRQGNDKEMYKSKEGVWLTKIEGLGYYTAGLRAGYCIQYLHQLQNVIFALTGEELEINL